MRARSVVHGAGGGPLLQFFFNVFCFGGGLLRRAQEGDLPTPLLVADSTGGGSPFMSMHDVRAPPPTPFA